MEIMDREDIYITNQIRSFEILYWKYIDEYCFDLPVYFLILTNF